ncbi:5-(carboxyamino)imidazole ribonucleotide mutase [candidate division TA06 bacterium]|uniref:N5-carboxyaminoimidazole ribonucleotide mutase n=1 Tax=candidate division TA06 bacterium TaxID=2250710 RepID=A0A523XW46_UNCT6|nr:MAG: 5-(carboxyamino)imidazole ribonucleotide mutase [candidate division TA06 bacterium]
MSKPVVGIIMGSKSDAEVMRECEKALEEFKIPFETIVSSAHRNPAKTRRYASGAKKRGIKVIIAGAGYAAHLPGFIASHTDLPVVGVPIPSSPFHGVDSLLSMVQMPKGVPVATMGLGKSGARNAAIFAKQILALGNARGAKAKKKPRKR